MSRRTPTDQAAAQRGIDRHLYVKRSTTDSNEGRPAAAACPCLILMVIFEDEDFDGDVTQHLMCPSCASGWVREVPCEKHDAEVIGFPSVHRLDGQKGWNR